MLSPSRRNLCALYYPFGNTRFRNVFDISNFQIDDERNVTIKILFLGCGDLRNTFKATLPNRNGNFKNLHIHLNDVNSSIMARNILILKIISASDFNPNNEEDLSLLWDVWYNTEWPDSTRKKFQEATKSLLDGSLPENVVLANSSQLQSLQEVWLEWLSDSSKTDVDANMLMSKMKNERSTFMAKCWNKVKPQVMKHQDLNPLASLVVTESLISKSIDEIASHQFKMTFGIDGINANSLMKKIRREIHQYFKSGNCRLPEIKSETVCFNPTMLQQATSKCWYIHCNLCPFAGYIPLTIEELVTSAEDGILIRSCQQILKQLVLSYQSRMEDVKLFFHLGDAMEFCYIETNDMFDIIDCSNLADYVGLANMINAASRRLSDAPGSTLFTESMNWNTLASSIIQYLEEALFTPLSMIPSTYGLRLFIENPLLLCWQKASPLQNVNLQSSPTLTRWLQQLARNCFCVTKEPVKEEEKDTRKILSMQTYTPLTFNFIVDSMIQRVGGDEWFNEARNNLDIPSNFHLHQRTIEAWKKGRTVVNLSTVINLRTPNTSFERLAADIAKSVIEKYEKGIGTPYIRLVLVPSVYLMSIGNLKGDDLLRNLLRGFSSPDAHYVDNLQLKVTKSSEGELETLSMSFPMIPDHGLEKTHGGYVLDLGTGFPFFFIPSMSLLRVEEFSLPYPHPTKPQPPLAPASSQMVADSCVETDSQYTLKISIGGCQNISGLKVDTDQQKPCESAHEITLSLSQPNNMIPLTLSFPYPFLVDNIRATLHRQDRFVDLILTKAVMEPWPCEFQVMENSKLTVERLKPLEEKEKSIFIHFLSTQFVNLLKNPSQSDSALFKVCGIIETLFKYAVSHGQEFFVVGPPGNQTVNWFLRVHLPIRSSPTRPILMLTAMSMVELSKNLTAKEKPKVAAAAADFSRVFPQSESVFIVADTEEAHLLRYILRFNSTKMVPSDWQKENVPLGENNLWLATFISPLYDEFQLRSNPIRKNDSCASCQAIPTNPKRCSRCGTIVYCSVECQRAHWKQHKIVCAPK